MRTNRYWFTELTMFGNDNHKVKVGNGSLLTAKGFGDINVKVKNTDDSYSVHYKNVSVMSGMYQN